MVLVENGMNKIRDMIYTDLSTGIFGTSGTEVFEDDTGLGGAVAATSQSLTMVKYNKGLSITHVLDDATGNGNSLREFGLRNADGTPIFYSRSVFPVIAKDNTIEITTTVQLILIQQ